MLDLVQRNIIRGYLDDGLTPVTIADAIGRVNDLEPGEVSSIRSAAREMLADEPAGGWLAIPAGRRSPATRAIR